MRSKKKRWSDGELEWWSIGREDLSALHHSNTPILPLVSSKGSK
jgi:hypothetical protein